ncbi:DUF6682 family protein [Pseudomonas aeruginosa]|uniref:phage adaptor protein n=1 Tax=Pseudomonas aeruginosa TaxID=287 RepID=UPI0032E4B78D
MTLADLIRRVRTDANDMVEPYFWSDQDVADWLNDAVREAAVRGRLIHESQADAVCRIEVVAGTAVYQLHASLYELSHLGFYPADMSRPTMPVLKSAEALDVELPEWRACTGKPLYAIQGDTSLRLVPTPDRAGILRVEGYRTPLADMTLTDKDTVQPEIHLEHHRHLVQWALHRGFSIPDMESFDPSRAALAEDAFTAYFGQRPDSDLRRITREDVPHHVEAFWP